jgi:thiol:disulfide interchange protein DsbD
LIPAGAGLLHAVSLDSFSGDPVSIRTYSSLTTVPQGGRVKAAIELRVEHPWHVNANRVTDPYLIPTSVVFDSIPGIRVIKILYPEGVKKKLSFSEKPLLLYSGIVRIGALLEVADDFPLGDTTVTATVTYQACDNEKCLAPVDKEISIALSVSSRATAIDSQNDEIFSGMDFGEPAPSGGLAKEPESNRLEEARRKGGMFLVFILVFLGGLALDLTPCIYPIIPITVSYFGGQSGGRSRRTFMLAALYVLGMAAMYSSLGVIASSSGSMLGSALQKPPVLIGVALVMAALSLSMFGLYEIRVPAGLSRVAGTSKQGAVGAFLMGLTVGIVAAPCIGPFILGLLTFVGGSGDPVLGFFLFFVLALGLGLPFLVLAVLAGSISSLPRSGEWMEWVRKVFGFVLLLMAVYFLGPVIGRIPYYILFGLICIAGGVILGFTLKITTEALFFIVLRRFVGVTAPLLGLYLIFTPGHVITGEAETGIPWQAFDQQLIDEARRSDTPVMIDFFADWCIPCKELDHKTFSRHEVINETKGIAMIKADLTKAMSEDVRKLRKAYDIKGVPTIVFIDRNGRERKDLRVFGFVDAEDLLERIRKLKAEDS